MKLKSTIQLAALITLTSSASAAVVSFDIDDFVASNTPSASNEITGGSSWEITIMEAGVTFTADVTVTGLQTDDGTDIRVGNNSGEDFILVHFK